MSEGFLDLYYLGLGDTSVWVNLKCHLSSFGS